jgi:hypothetical protein
MMRRIVALPLMSFVLLAAAPAYAQIEECTFFKRQIDALVVNGGASVNPPSNDPAVILLAAEAHTRIRRRADRANRPRASATS